MAFLGPPWSCLIRWSSFLGCTRRRKDQDAVRLISKDMSLQRSQGFMLMNTRTQPSSAAWLFTLGHCLQGVANRDLKLENLLLDRDGSDGTRPLLKICDFGVSKHVDDSTANTTVGTPVCMVRARLYMLQPHRVQKLIIV